MEGSVATASAGRAMMNGGDLSRRFSGRPSPKRGQVKMGIVVGLANSVASIFNPHGSSLHRQASKSQLEACGEFTPSWRRFEGYLHLSLKFGGTEFIEKRTKQHMKLLVWVSRWCAVNGGPRSFLPLKFWFCQGTGYHVHRKM
ncbi:unnamed protein product [Malus baccata var. baccata]